MLSACGQNRIHLEDLPLLLLHVGTPLGVRSKCVPGRRTHCNTRVCVNCAVQAGSKCAPVYRTGRPCAMQSRHAPPPLGVRSKCVPGRCTHCNTRVCVDCAVLSGSKCVPVCRTGRPCAVAQPARAPHARVWPCTSAPPSACAASACRAGARTASRAHVRLQAAGLAASACSTSNWLDHDTNCKHFSSTPRAGLAASACQVCLTQAGARSATHAHVWPRTSAVGGSGERMGCISCMRAVLGSPGVVSKGPTPKPVGE